MTVEEDDDVVQWVCSYKKDGKLYGITLWASDPGQILEDWCDRLDELIIEGVLIDEQDT